MFIVVRNAFGDIELLNTGHIIRANEDTKGRAVIYMPDSAEIILDESLENFGQRLDYNGFSKLIRLHELTTKITGKTS